MFSYMWQGLQPKKYSVHGLFQMMIDRDIEKIDREDRASDHKVQDIS